MSTEAPQSGFFSKERITAPPGFNRWMIPPAALAVHLCIGQAYAFSVFNGPMTKLIGIQQPAPDDWGLPALGWIFSLAILFLGLSAAFAGKWLEEVGPRKAMFVAACCFGGADGRSLYVTSASVDLSEEKRRARPLAGSVFVTELDVSGPPARPFAG